MISVHYILADSDITQHYPYTFDKTRVMNWIDKSIERYNIFGFGLWAVCLKDNGEMIGDCGLTMQIINNQIKPEIGYHFRKDMQHKGYAKEASIAVRDWTFINTPFNTVYSYMKKDNIAPPLSLCHTVVKNLMNLLTVKMKQLLCTKSQGQSGKKLKYNFIQKFT